VLDEDHGLVERVCRRQRGAGTFKGLRDVHDDKRLILTSQQDAMIDLGGRARVSGAGSVLRARLTSYRPKGSPH
jgi:hypothetical protein